MQYWGLLGIKLNQLGTILDQFWANLQPTLANLGQPWAHLGPSLANLAQTWANLHQLRPNLHQLWAHLHQFRAKFAQVSTKLALICTILVPNEPQETLKIVVFHWFLCII